ncbi:ParA family protein [Eubacterium maltosivorans]|uniref:ParA family protein n=1 Tax=Eubacterium maltosivorans TaxID=2041044 RepID=UPI003A8F7DDB
MNAKIVVLFNHKGGVSKTTTTYNLGWMLTEFRKKVLFVDGDPQCNLTELFLHDKFDDYYLNDDTKSHNLKDALAVAFEGKPRPIEAINCFSPDNNNRAFLIPGHMDLAEYESSLSLALNSNNAIVTLQNLPGSFYELIRLCCEKYGIDYVLIDMNPGLSAINQTFLMISDAFIVPTNPDPFSTMALKTLKSVLPRWKKQAQNARILFQDASYPLPETEIKAIPHRKKCQIPPSVI